MKIDWHDSLGLVGIILVGVGVGLAVNAGAGLATVGALVLAFVIWSANVITNRKQ